MTLAELLVALSGNAGQYITLVDGDTDLITFNAAGYASVESDLGERTVESIVIADPRTIRIILAANP